MAYAPVHPRQSVLSQMFIYLSKVVWFFLQPTSLLIALVALGAFALWLQWTRTAKRLVGIAAIGLVTAAYSPVGNWLFLPLEERFPRPALSAIAEPAGIIVLGGALNPLIGKSRGVVAVNEAAERFIAGAELLRKFPNAKFVFTGGGAAMLLPDTAEAEGVKSLLFPALGLPADRLILESKSRNTYENAVFTKELLAPKVNERWILVTSAFHMPRAVACFRKAGFTLIPWPVDYRTRGMEDLTLFFAQPSEGLKRVDKGMREWIGLLAYWLSGKTDSLFPGPK